MKRIILISIFFFSIYSNAQFVALNKVDEFTNNRVIQVNATKGNKWRTTDNIAKGFFNYIYLSIKNIKENQSSFNILTLDVTTGAQFCVSPGNGELIILTDKKTRIPLKQITEVKCNNRIAISYNLTIEALETLSKENFSKFRIYFSDGYIDFETKEESLDIIRNTFLLYKNEINKP